MSELMRPFSIREALIAETELQGTRHSLTRSLLQPFRPLLEEWLLGDLERFYQSVRNADGTFFTEILKGLDIRYQCASGSTGRTPKHGPAMVVANHPFGIIEGIILLDFLSFVRPDVRLLANSVLATLPQLKDRIFAVDPFAGPDAVRHNQKAVRQSIAWLRGGGALVVFPAGEVASLHLPELGIADPPWTENVVRLARKTEATLVPVFFHGFNSPGFHAAGLLHPRLRTALLPRELLNKAGATIHFSVGKPIPPSRIENATSSRAATEYVRGRTMLLGAQAGGGGQKFKFPNPIQPRRDPIIEPRDPLLMEAEVEALPRSRCLVASGEHQIWIADAEQIPETLLEIGRLREMTFRQVGEGTGAAVDLDSFDAHYEHLFLWHKQKREVAGAYRLTRTAETMRRFGARGLYTNTLFQIQPAFHAFVRPAIELGRSFVRPEYQKGFQSLLLLWRGLGQYVVEHPECRFLYGPVSISQEYAPLSRALMVSYFRSTNRDASLAAHVRPRKPFRLHGFPGLDPGNLTSLVADVSELSEIISDVEPDGKKIPVLLQHYLGLGGQVLEFNVDRRFSNALDGLIVVDLVKSPLKQLERYMGKAQAANFLQIHSQAPN